MRRHLLGIIGVVLLTLAAVLFLFAGGDSQQVWLSACLRIGLVLVMLWMAWPEIASLTRWVGPVAIVAALILATTVKSFGVLLPVLIGLWGLWIVGRFLRPLPKKPPQTTRISESSDREVPS